MWATIHWEQHVHCASGGEGILAKEGAPHFSGVCSTSEAVYERGNTNFSEAHLMSSILHPKTYFSENLIACRWIIPWRKYKKTSFFETSLAFRRFWDNKESRYSKTI